MNPKSKFDISSEAFDLYFAKEAPKISSATMESLPKDVVYRLFKKDYQISKRRNSPLNFLAKLYILWRACKKRIFIVIEDEETGIDLSAFKELKKNIKRQVYSDDGVAEIIRSASFVIGNQELCNTFAFLNYNSASPAYRYLMKTKGVNRNNVDAYKKECNYVVRMLINYENAKKRAFTEKQMTPQEWYVLLALYEGKEVVSADIYNEVYGNTFQASKSRMKTAFMTLQNKGYVKKLGRTVGAKLIITPIGTDVINAILSNFIFRYQ